MQLDENEKSLAMFSRSYTRVSHYEFCVSLGLVVTPLGGL